VAGAWSTTYTRGGRIDDALGAAKRAVEAHAKFGSKKVAVPQLITACARLIEQYQKETL